MTSTRERQQRAAARARLAREMAQRQTAARKRRQRQAMVGAAAALLLIVAGTVWAVVSLTEDEPVTPPVAGESPDPAENPPPGECAWRPDDGPMAVDVGTPPEGEPREGTQVMTVATNLGEIEITMDLAASPCIAANFTHLASQQFFDGTKCHRMFPGILQCGDPNARGEGYRDTDGQGGPAYRFTSENLPVAQEPPYPAGTVAMANSGSPDTNGSQFFFIYEDLNLPPAYAVIGTITSGLDVLQQVGEAGHDGAFEPNPGGGHPNLEVVIETLQVSDPR